MKPHAAGRFTVQFSMGPGTHEKLRHAQALLGHRFPSGDLAVVFDRALDALIGQLEKRRFAATARPRPSRRASANPRHVPAQVKRAVWERDGGQCSFVGVGGRRCTARKFLEFDHAEPVARGGRASVDNVRLRCRGHNQYEAERTFGADFMRAKRAAARDARAQAMQAQARAAEETRARAAEEARVITEQHTRDVIACLATLGVRAGEARRAAEYCRILPDAGLEERVRVALRFLYPKRRVVGHVGTALGAGA